MSGANAAASGGAGAVAPAAAAAADAPLPSSVPELLRLFLGIQAQRAQHYSRFHAAFKAFLDTLQEGPYRAVMMELTGTFNECSKRVIAVETALRDALGRADLAAVLRRVQEAERSKLRLTVSHHALRRAHALLSFSWQHESEPEDPAAVATTLAADGAAAAAAAAAVASGAIRQGSLQDVTSGLALLMQHQHAGGKHGGVNRRCAACGCGKPPGAGGGSDDDAAGIDEPTQAEYEGAVSEALTELDAVVADINEALEELRYELEEEGSAEDEDGAGPLTS